MELAEHIYDMNGKVATVEREGKEYTGNVVSCHDNPYCFTIAPKDDREHHFYLCEVQDITYSRDSIRMLVIPVVSNITVFSTKGI